MGRSGGKLIALAKLPPQTKWEERSLIKGIRQGAFKMNLLRNLRVCAPLRETFSVSACPPMAGSSRLGIIAAPFQNQKISPRRLSG